MNYAKRVLLVSILLWAILLSACGSSPSISTNTLSAIYTSAAQTVEAQNATAIPVATDTISILTATDTEIAFPTILPTLVSSQPTSTSSGSSCNNSTYVSDVTVQDGTAMSPGQTFVKTWALQNTGTCTWDTNFTLRFFSGNSMSGTSGTVSSAIAPGQQGNVSVTLTAPLTAGTYQGNWRMADDSGITFGEIIDVVIDVSGNATATVETTETPAYTATATPITPTSTTAVAPTATTAAPPTVTKAPPPTATTAAPPPTATTAAPPPTATTVVATPTK